LLVNIFETDKSFLAVTRVSLATTRKCRLQLESLASKCGPLLHKILFSKTLGVEAIYKIRRRWTMLIEFILNVRGERVLLEFIWIMTGLLFGR
jgi:hypothetical protein